MRLFNVNPYEKWWMVASGAILFFFLIAVAISAYSGFVLPDHSTRIDPSRVTVDPPFAKPAVVQQGLGLYDVYIRAQIWSFVPNKIRIPAGSTVTFYLTSADLQHGFLIERTNVNVMVLPGHVSKTSARFDQPGEYRFVCQEYCGLGHQFMFGRIIVEPRS
jgi:cytochrome c oxidase subunit 2